MRVATALCCLSLLLISSGCGKKEPNGIVTGNVTYEGTPVTEGSVLFTSQATSFGGEIPIEKDGSYVIKTQIGGLPPGKYQVAVRWPKQLMNATRGNSPDAMVPREVENIPKRYTSTKTSQLEVDVPDGGTTFDIKMTK